MGCIQTLGYFPNIYFITALVCFVIWSKQQKIFNLKKYKTDIACLVLIALSLVFQTSCGTPCDFPCIFDKLVKIGLILLPVIVLLIRGAKYMLKKLNKTID